MATIHPKDISIADYSYDLPEEKIAKFPLKNRDEAKMLVYKAGEIQEDTFKNIACHLNKGQLMVMNNTKVIQARLQFQKETGAHIEIFCLSPVEPADYVLAFQARNQCTWECMVGNARKWKEGTTVSKTLSINGCATRLNATRKENESTDGRTVKVDFTWEGENINWADILDAAGVLPIPPYLKRETQESDLEEYQTVYSKIKGSVAAPTAGLHFTDAEFDEMRQNGIESDEVTLHVGAGTFQPVKSETIADHNMHTEVISVKRSTVENILNHLGGIIAVGTTSVRTLESLYFLGAMISQQPGLQGDGLKVSQWMPYENTFTITAEEALQHILNYIDRNKLESLKASTQIIIAPGYEFKIVNAMVTNFHQPGNTLMLLVAAFVGEDWRKIYDYALSHNFRFLSYGDGSLLIK